MSQQVLPGFCLCGLPLPGDTRALPTAWGDMDEVGYSCDCGRFWAAPDGGAWYLSRGLVDADLAAWHTVGR